MTNWKDSTKVRDHRGRWDRESILEVLSSFKFNSENQTMILAYLCEGKGVTEFNVSKQQVYARLRKVVDKLVL